MSKRKRDPEDTGDAGQKEPATGTHDFRQQRRIAAVFAQSSTELAKAFKTARGFERQKLGRRKKNAAAAEDDKDIERIDAEVTALKALDLTACAQHYLAKSILKIKAAATSPHLPPDLDLTKTKPVALSRYPAALNVNARLCNSNPVKDAFPALLRDLKREFGIDDPIASSSKKPRLRAKDFREDEEEERSSPAVAETARKNRPATIASATGQAESDVGSEDSDDEFQGFEDRLGSGTEGGDLVEDSDLEDLERRLAEEGITRTTGTKTKSRPYDHAADLSLSEASSEDESVDVEPRKAAAPKKSSFIPSLTLGGYISGSGSDVEDEVEVAPKKNRRGQRARQQIWEKKYGTGAKHLQGQDRSKGWDPKRGAVDGKPGHRPSKFAKGANSEQLGRSRISDTTQKEKPAAPSKPKPRKDDTGPLHPSWEAAKRAKEKKSAPVAFAGKKISFD